MADLGREMLSDYELTARLGGDGPFELRRGRRLQTGAPVLLKLPRAPTVRPPDAAALRRECALAVQLRGATTLLAARQSPTGPTGATRIQNSRAHCTAIRTSRISSAQL